MKCSYFLILVLIIIANFEVKAQQSCDYGYVFNGTACEECGVTYYTPNSRIVGGIKAVPHSWPAQVLILQTYKFFFAQSNKVESQTFVCGGTLINRRTVLSAAHCIIDTFIEYDYFGSIYKIPIVPNNYTPSLESMFSIYIGIHDITFLTLNKNPDPPGIKMTVQKYYKHESYNEDTFENDISLFTLSKPVELNTNVQIACLPQQQSTQIPASSQNCWAAGWGYLAENGNMPTELFNVKLTIYDFSKCNTLSIKQNPDAQICAGELVGGLDTCQGDSGGGLYVKVNISQKQRYMVSGITSYGDGCGKANSPGIYTRTSYYYNWIQSKLGFSLSTNTVIFTMPSVTTTKTSKRFFFNNASYLNTQKFHFIILILFSISFQHIHL